MTWAVFAQCELTWAYPTFRSNPRKVSKIWDFEWTFEKKNRCSVGSSASTSGCRWTWQSITCCSDRSAGRGTSRWRKVRLLYHVHRKSLTSLRCSLRPSSMAASDALFECWNVWISEHLNVWIFECLSRGDGLVSSAPGLLAYFESLIWMGFKCLNIQMFECLSRGDGAHGAGGRGAGRDELQFHHARVKFWMNVWIFSKYISNWIVDYFGLTELGFECWNNSFLGSVHDT